MAVRSGAPTLDEPVPEYVWQLRHPTCANTPAPASAFAFPANPCRVAHPATLSRWSPSRASTVEVPLSESSDEDPPPGKSQPASAITKIATASSPRMRVLSMLGV